MLRIYHYEFCLELAVCSPSLKGIPTTLNFSQDHPKQLLYLPNTLERVRALHLRGGASPRSHTTTLYFPSEAALLQFWEEYRRTYSVVEAGGAVVLDKEDNLLFIWRRKRWDLPKGKREKNEPLEETARRELAEETGIDCPRADQFLTRTYHIYQEGDQAFLKEVSWYLFRCPLHKPALTLQTEEGIQDYRWVAPSEVPFLYPHSYGTIREVIEHVLREVLPTTPR